MNQEPSSINPTQEPAIPGNQSEPQIVAPIEPSVSASEPDPVPPVARVAVADQVSQPSEVVSEAPTLNSQSVSSSTGLLTQPYVPPLVSQLPADSPVVSSHDPTYDKAPKKKSVFKRLALIAAALVILLGGGGALAYVGYILPNEPNNVVGKSLENLISQPNGIGSYSLSESFSAIGGGSSVGSTEQVTVTGGADKNQNTLANVEVDFSVFKLSFSLIVRPSDENLFFKSAEINQFLGLVAATNPSISSQALNSAISALNNNWLEVNVAGLQSAGLITSAQASKANACVDSLKNLLTSSSSTGLNNVKNAYKAHGFINAKKAGTDSVNGVTATKYTATVNTQNYQQFSKSLSATDDSLTNPVDNNCGGKTSQTADTAVSKVSSPKSVTFWVSKGKKLQKFEIVIDSNNQEDDLVVSFPNQPFDASAPTNVVTVPELLKDIGGNTGAGSGLLL